ncbi:hypothetical protein EDD17DRAFT_1535996 [Pisolithus thermaeus]|nr:hypothetical protein EDD17DRAFT_1535996 [Pisolithus thermaeus]
MVVDKAVQQHDMPYERCKAENGNNEPVNSHGGEEDSLDIPSNSAETTDGHARPEVEVVDAQQADDDLQLVEDRATDSEWPEECGSALEAPGESSHGNLPEPSSEALKPVDKTAGQTGGYPIECTDNRHLLTSDEIILSIPDPPDARIECPTSGKHTPTQSYSATSMVLKQPVRTRRYKVPQGKQLLSVSMCPLTMPSGMPYWIFRPPEHENKKENMPLTKADAIPVAPEPPPDHSSHTPRPYRVLRRRGRLKSSTENIGIAHMRRNTYHTHAAPMWPPQPLSASEKRINFVMGGPQHSAVEAYLTWKCAQGSLIERRRLVGMMT